MAGDRRRAVVATVVAPRQLRSVAAAVAATGDGGEEAEERMDWIIDPLKPRGGIFILPSLLWTLTQREGGVTI